MIDSSSSSIRIAAVGDLLLTTKPGAPAGRGLEALSEEIRQLFASCDVVLANLECTLPAADTVATEPRVFTCEEQLQGLREAGINLVSLANNHAFDAMDEGFKHLTTLLKEQKLPFFGAGMNRAEAEQPVTMTLNGIRLAFIGQVDVSSGMHRFAKDTDSGVAPLAADNICRQIEALRHKVDHIIVSPHWGEERFRFPSPQQIAQGRSFIDAGASMVLGHHPHVLQGMELYRKAPIAYSLGNFLANPVYWNNGDHLTWSRFERTSCILLAELSRDGVLNFKQVPIFDDGESIHIESTGWGGRCLARVNQMLATGVTPARYRRETFRVRTLRPLLAQLRWAKLRRLRLEHFRKAFKLVAQGLK